MALEISKKLMAYRYGSGANIDANYGPWDSDQSYLDWLKSIGVSTPRVGTLIAIKSTDGINLYVCQADKSWKAIGGITEEQNNAIQSAMQSAAEAAASASQAASSADEAANSAIKAAGYAEGTKENADAIKQLLEEIIPDDENEKEQILGQLQVGINMLAIKDLQDKTDNMMNLIYAGL